MHWGVFTSSFLGKVAGGIFLAILAALGLGPEWLAGWLVSDLPITPSAARFFFAAFAFIVFLVWVWPQTKRIVHAYLRGSNMLASLCISAAAFFLFAGIMIALTDPFATNAAKASGEPAKAKVIVNRPKPIAIEATKGRVTFDYSTNNGSVRVGSGDCLFRVAFSKAGNTSIHMYTQRHKHSSNLKRLARVKGAGVGDILRMDNFDSSSTSYTVRIDEHFLAENSAGCFLQGKIISIKDDSRGADHDEVVFDYEINTEGTAEFAAL